MNLRITGMSDTAIKVHLLGKRYRIGLEEEQHDTLAQALISWVKTPVRNYQRLKKLSSFDDGDAADVIWALKDLSFEVKQGEVVGIIGRNGAGKSTLLKILSRITEPSSGYADIRGRVSSLLEVGTGFHQELTGRENVYLNGTILGMTKAEVARKFDEIVAFSEIEKFIDTPVKRYSTGMRVRLAFAVAAHLEPEILLVDEVLAVGDLGFQKKCLGKMDNVAQAGRTVIFVSHHMPMIQALCLRGIVMDQGKIVFDGPTDQAIARYVTDMQQISEGCPLGERPDRDGGELFRFQNVEFLHPDTKQPLATILSGQPVLIRIQYESFASRALDNVDVAIAIVNSAGNYIFECRNDLAGTRIRLTPGKGETSCFVHKWPLSHGRFSYALGARHGVRNKLDHIKDAGYIDVQPGDYYGNGMRPNPSASVLIDFDWIHDSRNADRYGLNGQLGLPELTSDQHVI